MNVALPNNLLSKHIMTNQQAAHAVVMIRPHQFTVNPQTAADNHFQASNSELSACTLAKRAYQEVTDAAQKLSEHGIRVHLFEDISKQTPDSVFPNNWFSTHANGSVGIYPMFAENRRLEVNYQLIEQLKPHYHLNEVIDYSGLADQQQFLEGTGVMVFDHVNRIAYAARSMRINEPLFLQFCQAFDYQPHLFNAVDELQQPIYHTNVMMSVTTDLALVCLDYLHDPVERDKLVAQLTATGKTIIELSPEQIAHYAGNVLEVSGRFGRRLAISNTAYQQLTGQQREQIECAVPMTVVNIPTIELAGGSIRCMLAGIHLPEKLPAS